MGLFDRYYNLSTEKVKGVQDLLLTAHVSLFVASKNSEVEPLSLRDIRDHFLEGNFTRADIIKREKQIRSHISYENEVSYLFDFTMLYAKVWKVACQNKLKSKLVTTYRFLCDVETAVYDLTKSLLSDAESLKFRQSILVAALFTAAIEISLRQVFEQR